MSYEIEPKSKVDSNQNKNERTSLNKRLTASFVHEDEDTLDGKHLPRSFNFVKESKDFSRFAEEVNKKGMFVNKSVILPSTNINEINIKEKFTNNHKPDYKAYNNMTTDAHDTQECDEEDECDEDVEVNKIK